MPESDTAKSYLQVHFCVILWGFTAIFGRLITLDALALVWWRVVIVALALLLVPRVRRRMRAMSWRLIGIYAAIGVLVAIHWLLFYMAIKLANASVGAICMAAAPLFLSVVEPRLMGRPFNPRELLLAAGIVPGVALIVGGIPSGMYTGMAIGLLSAIFAGIFNVCNKRMVDKAEPTTVTCIELAAGALFLTLLAPFYPHQGAPIPLPDWQDAWLLLIMALGCTLLPFALILNAMRHISAFGAQLAINLEPVYAVVLAIPILGEQQDLGPLFYAGVVVVVGVVMLHPLIEHHKARRASAGQTV